jgi:hypothetical protein
MSDFCLSPEALIFSPTVVSPTWDSECITSTPVSSPLILGDQSFLVAPRGDGTRFYMHSDHLLALPLVPAANFLSLESCQPLLSDSNFTPVLSFEDIDCLSQCPEWVDVYTSFAALRPAVFMPLSGIFPAYRDCASFSSFLEVASRLSAKALDIPAALVASSMKLSNADTGLDLNLISTHERGILNKGLFATLASAQSLLFPEALSPTTQISIGVAHPFYERIFNLAHGYNPVLLPPGFCPNFGRGISVLPSFIAPADVILAHFAKEQRAKRCMVVTESVFQVGCRRALVPYNLSNCFVIGKSPVDDNPLGRLLLNTPRLNAVAKRPVLEDWWGPLCPAQLVDLCQKLMNAKTTFPDTPIYGARRDVDSAYMRILMHIQSIPLCALLILIGGVRYVI